MQLYHESQSIDKMNTELDWDKLSTLLPDDIFVINYLDIQEDMLVSMTQRANKKFKKDNTNLTNKNIILVYEFEVMHSLVWNSVCDYLNEEGWNNILVIDGGFELYQKGSKPYHFAQSPFFYNCLNTRKYKQFEESVAEKDTLFSSLARRARYSRVRITADLLSRQLDTKGYVSCGWHEDCKKYFDKENEQWSKPWLNIIPQNLHDRFPVTLGHPDSDQWEVETGGLDKVCLNVVQETHVGWMYQEKYRTQTLSDRAHFTEKTAKPFFYFQLPLVFGTPFQVKSLQNQHFDMFDDIFDLSYDTELDVIKREKMFVDQIEKFCTKPVSYWQDYMLENKQRLLHNKNQLIFVYRHLCENLHSKLKFLN
jgi:hypothetical protein